MPPKDRIANSVDPDQSDCLSKSSLICVVHCLTIPTLKLRKVMLANLWLLNWFILQCAVRAATNGHVLVLEGIEKAERNVLPILNNLLENREMQLEDGRFLVAADRYDKLLQVGYKMSLIMRKPAFCICKNKDADQS